VTGVARALVIVAVVARAAAAQPAPADPAPTGETPAGTGVAWNEWRLQGKLLEPADTVRALLDTTMAAHPRLGNDARAAITAACETIGYHVIGLGTSVAGGKVVATLTVAPIPVVRSVTVDVDQKGFLPSLFGVQIEDEIQRRIRLRPGARLPWDPQARTDALRDEQGRIEEYLHDEGFFEATARVTSTISGTYGARIHVEAKLGREYKDLQVTVDTGGGQGVAVSEIRAQFREQQLCLVWRLCFIQARFSRARHAAALARVIDLYHRRGYPSVRVQSTFDPKTSFDRRAHTVRFTIRIDERRQIDVVFEGNNKDKFPDDQLRKQLTFDQAQSSDDYEVASSAAALVAYYQGKNRFDTQVTWSRERFNAFDRIVFRIDEGTTRQIRSVTFAGNKALPASALSGVITTKPYRTIRVFDANATATSGILVEDAEQVRRAYARKGYLEARVDVHAAPERKTLDSAALTGTAVAIGRKPGDLHVQFDIVEGPRTVVGELRVRVTHDDKAPASVETLTPDACYAALDELARRIGATIASRRKLDQTSEAEPSLGTTAGGAGSPSGTVGDCAATLDDHAFDEERLRAAGDNLRDWFWAQGRPRTSVAIEIDRPSVAAHSAILSYVVALGPIRTLGKVVVRGNFRTDRDIILGELRFREGQPLTSTRLAAGPRAVRSTGLFDAVNVELLDLDAASPDTPVNAVIRVEERYDVKALFDVEGGYSSQNGLFGKAKPALPNIAGTGIYGDVAVTFGSKYFAVESSARIPRWQARRLFPVSFDTELGGYWRSQDTERFGRLVTQGLSVGLTRSWQRAASEKVTPYLVAASLRYDFRVRNREEDALRPAGVDVDQDKVPVSTRTGSLGLSLRYDSRADHRGQYNPLAAERGGLVEASISLASPYLLGQDTFLKASITAQRFWPIGERIVLRTDLRVDEGFPLGDSVLLPEVERFFAGGDNTVRGFDEDRLATEIIETAVPPIDGLEQIRILPAGGNIRAVGSLDGQLLLVDRWLATALFIDAGMVRNRWNGIERRDIRPGAGAALRILTPFGTITVEYAFPLFPHLGDDPSGRIHFGLAFRQ
jgi:outer membrane protein assembly factor BamA